MTGDPTLPPPSAEEAQARQKAVVSNIVRMTGAAFLLAAPVVGFNLGGAADTIGLADGTTEKIIGGALLVAGVADFFIVPNILNRKN